MAQSHEKLVEEWLRRNRYFTIRSARIGYSEIDLLALKVEKTEKDGKLIDKIVRRHIEVQISLKPVSYITQNHAKKRTPEQIEKDVDSWVHKKYFSHTRQEIRDAFWGGGTTLEDWNFDFVHYVIKEPIEIELIKKKGINIITFENIVKDLRKDDNLGTARRGSDAADQVSLLKIK